MTILAIKWILLKMLNIPPTDSTFLTVDIVIVHSSQFDAQTSGFQENHCLILILAEFKIEKFPLMEWNTPVVNLANTITLFASATSNSNISTLQN